MIYHHGNLGDIVMSFSYHDDIADFNFTIYLMTAKEDERRRKEKYGVGSTRQSATPSPTLGNQSKKPEGSTGTSIISRPRPRRGTPGTGDKGVSSFEATGIGKQKVIRFLSI